MSDQALVERLKQGSQDAFEDLVKKYGKRLYSVSLRLLRKPEDAEDAVQDALLKAFQSINSFRSEASLYTWLYRIVCNECLMKLRKQSRRNLVPIEPYLPRFDQGQHVEAIGDWTRLPDLALETSELADFFEQCIDELSEVYRVAYILKDVEGLSEDQVCRVLRLTKPAVKNRVHRARLVIRKRIEERFFKTSPSRSR